MFKFLLVILIFISCSVEKPIQVKELTVACKEVLIVIKPSGVHYWTKWESIDGNIIYESYGRVRYKIGELRILFVKS